MLTYLDETFSSRLPNIEEAPEHLLEPTFRSCPSICLRICQSREHWLDFDKDLNAAYLFTTFLHHFKAPLKPFVFTPRTNLAL